jgi:hypothetical protein
MIAKKITVEERDVMMAAGQRYLGEGERSEGRRNIMFETSTRMIERFCPHRDRRTVCLWFTNNRQQLCARGPAHRKKVTRAAVDAAQRALETARPGADLGDVAAVCRGLGYGPRVASRLIRDDFTRSFAFE